MRYLALGAEPSNEEAEVYTGQNLGDRPHIGVIFCDSIGDFIVALPLLSSIRETYPQGIIDYFGGPRTAPAEAATTLIDQRYDAFGDILAIGNLLQFVAKRQQEVGPYDLMINLDDCPLAAVTTAACTPKYAVGRAATRDGRGLVAFSREGAGGLIDEDWTSPNILERYGKYLIDRHISHIFCALAHFPYPDTVHRFPISDPPEGLSIPDVVISVVSSREDKLWPAHHWSTLLDEPSLKGLSVGIIGTDDSSADRYRLSRDIEDLLLRRHSLQDLRALSVLQQGGLLQRARACVTVDNGLMHLSCEVGTPTVAMFAATSWELWAPRAPHLTKVKPLQQTKSSLDPSGDPGVPNTSGLGMEGVDPRVVLEALMRVL